MSGCNVTSRVQDNVHGTSSLIRVSYPGYVSMVYGLPELNLLTLLHNVATSIGYTAAEVSYS